MSDGKNKTRSKRRITVRNTIVYQNKLISFFEGDSRTPTIMVDHGRGFEHFEYADTVLRVSKSLGIEISTYDIREIKMMVAEQTMYIKGFDMIYPSNILQVNNGYCDLDKLAFFHKPPQRIVCRYILPVTLDVDAKCPEFDKFLEEVLLEQEDRDIIWQMFGYCLDVSRCEEEVGFFLLGPGGNGKSSLLNVLQAVLGKQNVSHIMYSRMKDGGFSLIGMRYKMANIHPDITWRGPEDTAILKVLISGETVNADVKRRDAVDYEPRAKLIFACKQLPYMNDSSYGYRRRWRVIRFIETFDGGKLKRGRTKGIMNSPSELSGILRKSFTALKSIRKNGFLKYEQNMISEEYVERRMSKRNKKMYEQY